jgi:triacylglycerol lipase
MQKRWAYLIKFIVWWRRVEVFGGLLHDFAMTLISFVFTLVFATLPTIVHAEDIVLVPTKKCAILLHGMGRSSWSMNKMAKSLRKKEYVVWNESYPSTEKSIAELSKVIDQAIMFCDEEQATDIYFVTHSLGGILVRYYFQDKNPINVKGVVMLAPPNKGSEVADAYKDWKWYQWFTGPAGQELGTDAASVPNMLSPISVPVGVIAGTATSDPWFSGLFSGPNDGKVSVYSAQIPEMVDFMTVDSGHTFIMKSKTVIENVLYFFDNRSFKK